MRAGLGFPSVFSSGVVGGLPLCFSAAACVTSKGVPIGKARLAEIRVDSILGRNSNRINFNGISAIADRKKTTEIKIVVLRY